MTEYDHELDRKVKDAIIQLADSVTEINDHLEEICKLLRLSLIKVNRV